MALILVMSYELVFSKCICGHDDFNVES